MRAVFARGIGDVFVPIDGNAKKLISKTKFGEGISVEAVKIRNYKFHKKFFAMLNLAFQYWEPDSKEFLGLEIEKDFNFFRKQIIILSGHFRQVFNLDGTFALEAKSISFANMDDIEFESLYKSVFNVVWKMILRYKGFENESDAESAILDFMNFD